MSLSEEFFNPFKAFLISTKAALPLSLFLVNNSMVVPKSLSSA
jgi:hypothetical protein